MYAQYPHPPIHTPECSGSSTRFLVHKMHSPVLPLCSGGFGWKSSSHLTHNGHKHSPLAAFHHATPPRQSPTPTLAHCASVTLSRPITTMKVSKYFNSPRQTHEPTIPYRRTLQGRPMHGSPSKCEVYYISICTYGVQ